MKLRYPNARLSIFNLLHNDGIRCNEALVKGSYEIGLLKQSNTSPGSNETNGDCGSLDAINTIVKTYFDQRKNKSDKHKDKLVNETIDLINKDIHDYKLRTGIVHPKEQTPNPIECGNLAPAAFDILLQHLHHFD